MTYSGSSVACCKADQSNIRVRKVQKAPNLKSIFAMVSIAERGNIYRLHP